VKNKEDLEISQKHEKYYDNPSNKVMANVEAMSRALKRLKFYEKHNEEEYWEIAIFDIHRIVRAEAYVYFNDKDHWEMALDDRALSNRMDARKFLKIV